MASFQKEESTISSRQYNMSQVNVNNGKLLLQLYSPDPIPERTLSNLRSQEKDCWKTFFQRKLRGNRRN